MQLQNVQFPKELASPANVGALAAAHLKADLSDLPPNVVAGVCVSCLRHYAVVTVSGKQYQYDTIVKQQAAFSEEYYAIRSFVNDAIAKAHPALARAARKQYQPASRR